MSKYIVLSIREVHRELESSPEQLSQLFSVQIYGSLKEKSPESARE